MPLNDLYQARILEHNRAPCNRFEMPDATHSARGLDALCGDDLQLWLNVRDGVVERASWSGEACVITTASASMLSDWVIGKRPAEIERGYRAFAGLLEDPESDNDPQLGPFNALQPVGRFPSRKRNALLPWKTALDALNAGKQP
ncbi:MAG: SUF system NifU family Fe-S cluster assembly protein [Wenzhouxiangellaceae bacterium]|nr:SUF system NifU family Fe-S cluster assembly protein [Wenzhouxiangellaceae bacterium]